MMVEYYVVYSLPKVAYEDGQSCIVNDLVFEA
jgi:hypothetical protein